ncbi:hypothetical protein INS49_010509 [Diaporthe citri]|uniref:uncharacterized protein n=1 Tax=Diaporthe citri TaxID=83186 RepID=UPI001C7E5418|nr:uncharacterized protein INS49_010509 [Diaporthe citri]KAG6362279.1 hypothetical protein INS49_010509 [Diaporthe citri]
MSISNQPSTQGLGLRGRNINGCSINIDHLDSHHCNHQENSNDALPLPATLSIFFNPDRNLAFFRLRAQISLEVGAETRTVPFFLHIPPDKIDNLSLHQHARTADTTGTTGCPNTIHPSMKTCLRFRLATTGSISIVAPQSLPAGNLRAANPAACNTLDALRLLAQQAAICISLPPAAATVSDPTQLTALCEAVSTSGRLHPDPVQANLRSLYRGEGGRVVEVDELVPFSNNDRPPLSLFAGLPPAYPDVAADAPPHPSPGSGPKRRQHKRPRTRSPSPTVSSRSEARSRSRSRSRSGSRSSSSSPRYNKWQHLNLAVGEREKIMAELLRRTEKKEKAIEELLRRADKKEERLGAMLCDIDEKRMRVTDETRKLTALIASSEDCRRHQQQEQQLEKADSAERAASQVSTASPAPPGPPASEGHDSTASVSTDVSDRVQAYIATQLDGLRDEMRTLQQSTANDMDELMDRRLEDYVEEEDMFDAIRGAVDEAVAGIRDRILDAWI